MVCHPIPPPLTSYQTVDRVIDWLATDSVLVNQYGVKKTFVDDTLWSPYRGFNWIGWHCLWCGHGIWIYRSIEEGWIAVDFGINRTGYNRWKPLGWFDWMDLGKDLTPVLEAEIVGRKLKEAIEKYGGKWVIDDDEGWKGDFRNPLSRKEIRDLAKR